MTRDGSKPRKGKAWRRLRPRGAILAVVALFIWLLLSSFVYVWSTMQVVQLGYRLSEAHQVHARLLDDNRKLHLELARLSAPERVEEIATRLGLRHPSKDQIVVLP